MFKENIGLTVNALGSLFILIATIGALRMPDLMTRMHASTKGMTLGLWLGFAGSAIRFSSIEAITKSMIGISFIALTAPVAAHAIARSFYYLNERLWDGTVVDECQKVTDSDSSS